MICFLYGKIERKFPAKLEIDVGGVGYEVFISLNTFDELPDEGEMVKILIFDYIKEDTRVLYGFSKEDEREIFKLLIQVNRVGPKAALAILSRLSPLKIKNAIINENVSVIAGVSGIGKKTAERIVMELKEKIQKMYGSMGSLATSDIRENEVLNDAVDALEQLGYKRNNAYSICIKILSQKNCGLEELIKEALRRIS